MLPTYPPRALHSSSDPRPRTACRPQDLLPSLYQGNDVFLFTSQYEAWGMPVLEAMASGLAVVTTTCLGVDTFCRHSENCLMAGQDDVAGLASHVLQVGHLGGVV